MALLFAFLLILFSGSTHAYECGTINITGSWKRPLSPVGNCSWFIQFPPDSYVQMYLRAVDMDPREVSEQIIIEYTDSQLIRIKRLPFQSYLYMVNGNVSLNASYVMPYYVGVSIDPSKSSKMQLEIQIELVPNNYGKNIQQTFSTGLNKPTELVYFEDLQDGATYNLKTDSGRGYVSPAFIWDRLHQRELWNIWIYLDGKYLCSMYDVTSWNEDFLNGAVSVYIVERPAFLKGALIFNDYINYVELYRPQNVYLSVNENGKVGAYWMIDGEPKRDTAMTVVGAKDGSTPYSVYKILLEPPRLNKHSVNEPAYVSYLNGGVVRDHQNATDLRRSQLPFPVTGNLNTFYVKKGEANVVKIIV